MDEFDPTDPYEADRRQMQDEQRRKLAQQQANEDFTWLMADPRGRRIVWNQLSTAGVFQGSFDQSPATMAFNEGRRSEGLRLLAQVMALGPDLYTLMMKEQSK